LASHIVLANNSWLYWQAGYRLQGWLASWPQLASYWLAGQKAGQLHGAGWLAASQLAGWPQPGCWAGWLAGQLGWLAVLAGQPAAAEGWAASCIGAALPLPASCQLAFIITYYYYIIITYYYYYYIINIIIIIIIIILHIYYYYYYYYIRYILLY